MLAAQLAVVSLLGPANLDLQRLPEIKREPQTTFVDRSGAVLGVRGGRYGPPVDMARLPAYVPAAFVAIEDRRFYEHVGFDPLGMARAIVSDLGHGSAREGASTITQQLAKNLFLNGDKTVERKATELVLAVQLERAYTKRQILGLYLSRVYFGSGAYGIEAAANRYFNISAPHLNVKQAAMLAAVMKSPTAYDPALQPLANRKRADLVLQAMVDTGALSATEAAKAAAQNPKVWRNAPTAPAQYFVDWVDAQTRQKLGKPNQDLVVETTLDLDLEASAAGLTRKVTQKFQAQKVNQAALVALDGNGRVRAMIGGTDYGTSSFNRAINAHRQAGSSWKPFVYLTALESGRTPQTLVVDEPVTIGTWSPHNYEEGHLGQITLETALAQSINTVAARLADEVGRDRVAAVAHRAGITSAINTDPAMALGTTLVTPIEMASAYDSFANGGYRVPAYGIERIRSVTGAVLYKRTPTPPSLPQIANPALGELDQMLRTVLVSGTGVHAQIAGYDLAGKTGTTSDYKDAWFCGFSGGFTTVVWLGRDDATPMRRITGGSAPAELWRGFMSVALKRQPPQPIPAGVAPEPPPVETISATTNSAILPPSL